jgi:hypothetical protein
VATVTGEGGTFGRLRALVLDDPAQSRRLLAITDRQAFTRAVAEVAEGHGLDFGAAAVEAALVDARRSWLERWV